MEPTVIQIDWPISHDHEDFNIREQLEAGGDEGPLLVLSAEGRRRPGRERFVAIFRNVDWYIASLVEQADNAPRERWVGARIRPRKWRRCSGRVAAYGPSTGAKGRPTSEVNWVAG